MAKGVYRLPDGQVMVDYGRRQASVPRAQYKANGYLPPYDKLGEDPRGTKNERSTRRRYRPPPDFQLEGSI
jgi:hypothetical protein